jgi:hypothetical protein
MTKAVESCSKKHKIREFFKSTPAIVISISAACAILWGIFIFAVEESPLGDRVQAVEKAQTADEAALRTLEEEVKTNESEEIERHNQILSELYTVQILGMIDRDKTGADKQQIILMKQKFDDVGGKNTYLSYELEKYLQRIK